MKYKISCFIAFCMIFSQAFAEIAASSKNKYFNYLILAEPVQLDSIDTKLSVNAHTKLLFPLIFESLIRMEANRIAPVLANSWVVSADNNSIEFTYPFGQSRCYCKLAIH